MGYNDYSPLLDILPFVDVSKYFLKSMLAQYKAVKFLC